MSTPADRGPLLHIHTYKQTKVRQARKVKVFRLLNARPSTSSSCGLDRGARARATGQEGHIHTHLYAPRIHTRLILRASTRGEVAFSFRGMCICIYIYYVTRARECGKKRECRRRRYVAPGGDVCVW